MSVARIGKKARVGRVKKVTERDLYEKEEKRERTKRKGMIRRKRNCCYCLSVRVIGGDEKNVGIKVRL